jgi:hypothetical protein
LFVWEVATGKRLPPVFRGDAMILDKVAFSHDAALLAVMHSDCTMCLVSTATGQEIRRLGKGQGEMTARPIFTPDGRILVTAGGGLFQRGLVQFWEIATGGEIARREGHKGSVKAFVVSADGRLLATVSDDHTILVWDLARLFPDDPSAPASTESLWMELANQNAQLGRRAIERLIASPVPAIQLLREHLKPVEGPDAKELARLIADLDVSGFEQRERGEQALGQLAELAESAQRKALAGNPSAEARRRIENLLAKLDPWRMSIEQVRVVRAVQALEGIGNVEARRLLADWAGGAAGARLTKEATAACTRLRASQ